MSEPREETPETEPGSEPETASARDVEKADAAKTHPASTAKSSGRVRFGEVDESAINSPSYQTLIMLGVLSLATIIMWAAGRAACNYHVPGEGLTPRDVSLVERTRTPKGVGMEFGLSLAGADFARARQLAVGKAEEKVAAEERKCKACEARRDAREDLLAVADVLRANSVDSFVRVRTAGAPDPIASTFLLRIQRSREAGWKVTELLEAGATLPELEEPPVSKAPPQVVRRVPAEHEGAEPDSEGSAAPDGVAASDSVAAPAETAADGESQ